MCEELSVVIKQLGVEGLNAYYVSLALEYFTSWLIVGLGVWIVRDAMK